MRKMKIIAGKIWKKKIKLEKVETRRERKLEKEFIFSFIISAENFCFIDHIPLFLNVIALKSYFNVFLIILCIFSYFHFIQYLQRPNFKYLINIFHGLRLKVSTMFCGLLNLSIYFFLL